VLADHLHRVSSPIHINRLIEHLDQYPQTDVAFELIEGFRQGFHLQYSGPRLASNSPNLLSVQRNPELALQLVLKEVSLGRVAGPFITRPIYDLRLSPLGLVPKHDGSMRLIHHLSYPFGEGVNDYIDPDKCSVNYSSFDHAVQMVSDLGPGSLMGKMDIKSAFRLLPVHPDDFSLLGFRIGQYFFFDKCMPMGCAISCAIFEKFSTFLEWAVKCVNPSSNIDHYLDDFFFAGRAGTAECSVSMHHFSDLCLDLGVPLAKNKTVGPTTVLQFLGLEIDSINRRIRMCEILREKLIKIKECKKATLRDFQSLAGSLNFCSRAIPVARAFIRRFYDVMATVSKPHHFIRVSKSLKEDINMWLVFLDSFNGYCKFPERDWFNDTDLNLFTDSAGVRFGCAAYLDPHWCHFNWPTSWESSDLARDITCLELIPIVLAFLIWLSQLSGKKIILHTDNKALVSVLNKKTSKSKRVMHFLRPFLLHAMLHDIQFRAVHIDGVRNGISDALSRRQWARFRHLAPRADRDPAPVPAVFLSLISDPKLIAY